MKKILVFFMLSIILISCNKNNINKQQEVIQQDENYICVEKNNFDEIFYNKINHFFSMNRGAYTLNDDPYYVFFQPYRVENDDKVMSLKIYMIDKCNSDYYLEYRCSYSNGLVTEEKHSMSSYISYITYDSEKRIKLIETENGKKTEYKYLCDYENNTYSRIDNNDNKKIIRKLDNGYEIIEVIKDKSIIYKYYYDDKNLIKTERISDISKYTYEYEYLENKIIQKEIYENKDIKNSDYSEINFLGNNKIEIIYHKDAINPERKIILSEFDDYNNWCLAEEYEDSKIYAKYKRVFDYVE